MHVADPLSWPRFALTRIVCPPGTPGAVRQVMDVHGIPERSVGGEYTALSEATFLKDHPTLLAFGQNGLSGRICLDIDSLRVVHVPIPEAERINAVNSDLAAFNACVAAAIIRFPYYTYETADEIGQEVAESLRHQLVAIDPTVGAHNGLWETFFDDVAMGNYAEEEYEQAP